MARPINTFVISDLHLGHRRIAEFRPVFDTAEQHDECMMDGWVSVVGQNDKVWVLGDASFGEEAHRKLCGLPGVKYLVAGNHDTRSTREQLECFREVRGAWKYKRPKREAAWLTHVPIHPKQLRGGINIHGHTHGPSPTGFGLYDCRYISVCPEVIGYAPILLHPLLPRKEPPR